jgi:hypothetical protein
MTNDGIGAGGDELMVSSTRAARLIASQSADGGDDDDDRAPERMMAAARMYRGMRARPATLHGEHERHSDALSHPIRDRESRR